MTQRRIHFVRRTVECNSCVRLKASYVTLPRTGGPQGGIKQSLLDSASATVMTMSKTAIAGRRYLRLVAEILRTGIHEMIDEMNKFKTSNT